MLESKQRSNVSKPTDFHKLHDSLSGYSNDNIGLRLEQAAEMITIYFKSRFSCRDKLKLAFQALIKQENIEFFMSALRDVISLFVSFRSTNSPPFVISGLQSVSYPPPDSHIAFAMAFGLVAHVMSLTQNTDKFLLRAIKIGLVSHQIFKTLWTSNKLGYHQALDKTITLNGLHNHNLLLWNSWLSWKLLGTYL